MVCTGVREPCVKSSVLPVCQPVLSALGGKTNFLFLSLFAFCTFFLCLFFFSRTGRRVPQQRSRADSAVVRAEVVLCVLSGCCGRGSCRLLFCRSFAALCLSLMRTMTVLEFRLDEKLYCQRHAGRRREARGGEGACCCFYYYCVFRVVSNFRPITHGKVLEAFFMARSVATRVCDFPRIRRRCFSVVLPARREPNFFRLPYAEASHFVSFQLCALPSLITRLRRTARMRGRVTQHRLLAYISFHFVVTSELNAPFRRR